MAAEEIEHGKGPVVPRALSRRAFLGVSVAIGGSAALLRTRASGSLLTVLPFANDPNLGVVEATAPRGATPDLTISVERDTDLLLLDFFFFGFYVDTSQKQPVIRPKKPNATLVVRFPPQAVGEAAYKDATNDDIAHNPTGLHVDPPPVLSAVSGTSQLAFTFSLGTGIRLSTGTAADLLDWSSWKLAVPPVAQVARTSSFPRPVPSAPGPLDTSIEFPYALFLAPVVGAGLTDSTTFTNRARPLASPSGVVDLFTSKLTTTHAGAPGRAEVSAIWSRDKSAGSSATPETTIYYDPAIAP